MTLPSSTITAVLLLAVGTALPVAAVAADKPDPSITVSNGWFATVPNNGPTYGYFQITNHGTGPRLISHYSSPNCSTLNLEEAHGGGTNSREPVSMTVAAKSRLVFSRGGYHLVCERKNTLSPGQTISVTITLDTGTAINTTFAVRDFPK